MRWKLRFLCPALHPTREVEANFFVEFPSSALFRTASTLYALLEKALQRVKLFPSNEIPLDFVLQRNMSVTFWRRKREVLVAFDCAEISFRGKTFKNYQPPRDLRSVFALGIVPVGALLWKTNILARLARTTHLGSVLKKLDLHIDFPSSEIAMKLLSNDKATVARICFEKRKGDVIWLVAGADSTLCDRIKDALEVLGTENIEVQNMCHMYGGQPCPVPEVGKSISGHLFFL